MAVILITGVHGIIGSIVAKELALEHHVRGVDLPEDASSPDVLAERLGGVETVIHLARERHPPEVPSAQRDAIRPKNVAIDINVFTAAIAAGVRRLIFASSVHADDFRGTAAPRPLTVPGSYRPATPYGAYKLIVEEAGRVVARRFGLEFVALRLGGVTADGTIKPGGGRTATWLSHRDLASAFEACIAAPPIPGRATVFYVVSDNRDRIHDVTNPFGWWPRDDSARQ